MLYLYIDQNQIKLFHVKKSLLGQYTIGFYHKKFQVDLLKDGKVLNVDVLASAMKEIAAKVPSVDHSKDKDVTVILPQESFYFLRTTVPSDISSSAIVSFIKDKIKEKLPSSSSNIISDYFFTEAENTKHISLYSINQDTITTLASSLNLLDYRLVSVYPETLAYYKLFEKTLRKGKIEHILYGLYQSDLFLGYLYDSYGLKTEESIKFPLTEKKDIRPSLKTKAEEFEKSNQKINRFILSGVNADTVRQDLFTKEVGMWMNPLKRIIPQFYSEYIKLLMMSEEKVFPILDYDVCLGAFIFSIENKYFSFMKKQSPSVHNQQKKPTLSQSNLFVPQTNKSFFKKEYLLFALSFILSFLIFQTISQGSVIKKLPLLTRSEKPSPTPSPIPPTPTPTVAVQKEKYKIKVLNGSGTSGKASEVRDILKKNNYQDILTGNADNFDYTRTEINIKQEVSEIKPYLLQELNDYVSNPQIGILDSKETADITIIVGTDFK